MKLICCTSCQDVFKIVIGQVRTCKCGKCKGKGLNTSDAIYSGDTAKPVGFHNRSFIKALFEQPTTGVGTEFIAFVIPKQCKTFTKVDDVL